MKILHLTFEEAAGVHEAAVRLWDDENEENLPSPIKRLRNEIEREFGVQWRPDRGLFIKSV